MSKPLSAKKRSSDASKKSEAVATASGAVTKFQRFVPETIHRSKIQNAPYNPRVIDKHAKKKLRENLKKHGLIETIVWNERTGHIVGGHQRISCLDDLNGSDDYSLTVAKIDVDLETEKSLNVFLNNASAQGSWDFEKLRDVIKDVGGDWEGLGFDRVDIDYMFPDGELGSIFSDERETAGDAIAGLNDLKREAKGNEAASDAEHEPKSPDAAEDRSSAIDKIKAARKAYRDKVSNDSESEFFVVLVFDAKRNADAFLRALKLPLDDRYVDGLRIATELGIDLQK